MTLGQFTEPKLLIPQLECATKETALAELSKRLTGAGRVDNADVFLSAVLEHDALAPAVFERVAVALARGQQVKVLSFALGLSSHGIRWNVVGAPVVSAVFLFAVPQSAGELYLSLVLTLSGFISDTAAFSTLRRCREPEEMLDVLNAVRITRHPAHASGADGAPAG
jgi:mannitol/fructose-specific phosphotransferase system IIA component (Ntr-type)